MLIELERERLPHKNELQEPASGQLDDGPVVRR
jgi:hypothetical protein